MKSAITLATLGVVLKGGKPHVNGEALKYLGSGVARRGYVLKHTDGVEYVVKVEDRQGRDTQCHAEFKAYKILKKQGMKQWIAKTYKPEEVNEGSDQYTVAIQKRVIGEKSSVSLYDIPKFQRYVAIEAFRKIGITDLHYNNFLITKKGKSFKLFDYGVASV